MTAPLFRVNELSYCYQGRFAALDRIDLTIEQGESVALLGANGCGKSTLLKLLDGLIFPDTGSISAFGVPLSEDRLEEETFRRQFRSRVGFIFQNSDVQLFCPTVADELAFGPLQLDFPEEEVRCRVADLLESLDIADLRDRSPWQLSGGQKKRVAIAAVLAMNPDVLLLDEPDSGLDPRTQRWLIDLIGELRTAGKTIIIATHNLPVVDEIAARVVVLSEEHRIIADGATTAVLADEALLLRANLIDSRPYSHAHLHYPWHRHPHSHGGPALYHEHAPDRDPSEP